MVSFDSTSARNFTANVSRQLRAAGINARRTDSSFGPGVNMSPSAAGEFFCLAVDLHFWSHLDYGEKATRQVYADVVDFLREHGYPYKVLEEPYEHHVVEWSWKIHVESKHVDRNRCEGIILPAPAPKP